MTASDPRVAPDYLSRAIADGFLEDDMPVAGSHHQRKIAAANYQDLLADRKVGRYCVSRSGVQRMAHSLDRDGRCVFCDQRGKMA